MEGVLGIFKSIISLDNTLCDVYLNALDEHQSFASKVQKGSDEVVQAISSLLAKRETRALGLLLLNQFVQQCVHIDVLEEKFNLWISCTLKAAANASGLESQANLIYDTLRRLVEKSQQSPDLTKTFASNHLRKFYESLSHVPESGRLAALRCTATCLRLYAGPSGPARGLVERYMLLFVDTADVEVSEGVGKCMLLLQQVRSGQGINHKTQWQNYQLKLLTSLHAVLNEAFSKCTELYDDPVESGEPLEVADLKLSDEPVQRAAELYIRFCNLIGYLKIALREPFPVEKPIMPKKILNLINRGLSMTCPLLQRNAILDNLALGALLPKMHLHLLELLEVLILTLRSHLRMHHELILGLLGDTLKWTSSKQSIGVKKPLTNLRAKIYQLISQWCTTLRAGSRCETIAELLIPEIINDVYPYQTEFTLKVVSGARKHMSKKARRQLHKTQNEQSNLAQAHANNPIRKTDLSDEGNQLLCIAALRCLHDVLLMASNFLKPTILKMLHNKLLQICGLFYELPLPRQHLYSNWRCRLEIYECLYALIMTPHHLCPPPTQISVSILQTAHVRDGNVQVRQICGTLLLNLEKLIHPQKEGLLFPVEARDVRNTFIKMGKEHLLNDVAVFGSGVAMAENHEECNQPDELQSEDETNKERDECMDNVGIDDNEDVDDIDDNLLEDTHTVLESNKLNSVAQIKPDILIDMVTSSNSVGSKDTGAGEKLKNDTKATLAEAKENQATQNVKTSTPTDILENAMSNSDNEEYGLAAPSSKRLKLENKVAATNVIERTEQEVQEDGGNANIDEDQMVAEIEAMFVDELNE